MGVCVMFDTNLLFLDAMPLIHPKAGPYGVQCSYTCVKYRYIPPNAPMQVGVY